MSRRDMVGAFMHDPPFPDRPPTACSKRNISKQASITGIIGRDGFCLAKRLSAKGYKVHGRVRG